MISKNKKDGLDFVIANQGYDKISLTNDTFQYWKNNLFSSIQIYNSKKQQILNITLDDIKNHILNKEIEYSYLLRFPIINSPYIPKNNRYYITFNRESNTTLSSANQQIKLISWILGQDPYQYYYKSIDGKKILYELWIDKNNSFHFYQSKD